MDTHFLFNFIRFVCGEQVFVKKPNLNLVFVLDRLMAISYNKAKGY